MTISGVILLGSIRGVPRRGVAAGVPVRGRGVRFVVRFGVTGERDVRGAGLTRPRVRLTGVAR